MSFRVLIILSARPLALELPTVIRLCLIFQSSMSDVNIPCHSVPLSVRIHFGLPHRDKISRWNHAAVRNEFLLYIGVASTHFDMQSTATVIYLFPSSSFGNGPARSIDQPYAGYIGLSLGLYASFYYGGSLSA